MRRIIALLSVGIFLCTASVQAQIADLIAKSILHTAVFQVVSESSEGLLQGYLIKAEFDWTSKNVTKESFRYMYGGNRYTVAVGVEDAITDIDLYVYEIRNGQRYLVAEDKKENNTPLVSFTATNSAYYVFVIKAHSFAPGKSSGYYFMNIYHNSDGTSDQIANFMYSSFTKIKGLDGNISHLEFDTISKSGSNNTKSLFRNLYGGYTYLIGAIGDDAVKDIDLKTYEEVNGDWNLIVTDNSSDKAAINLVTASQSAFCRMDVKAYSFFPGYTSGYYALYLFSEKK